MRKELASLATDFGTNVTKATAHVTFTREQLAGVPEDFLNSSKVKTGDDEYTVAADETYQYELVEDNARNEATRHAVYVARDSRAKDTNVPIFNRMLALRNRIALKLGYKSWADFQTEVKMAKTGEAAERFIDDLIAQTQPKFDAEVKELAGMKEGDYMREHHILSHIEESGSLVSLDTWDARYYTNRLMKSRYHIDTEALRVYFPYQSVLDGMFRIYEHDFGLTFTRVEPPYQWVPDLQLFVASDAGERRAAGPVLPGHVPAPGQVRPLRRVRHHRRQAARRRQIPAARRVPRVQLPAARGRQARAAHPRRRDDRVPRVRPRAPRHAHPRAVRPLRGHERPGDFVEAPSQMLENWPLDKNVLDQFAADYRDSSKKIPTEVLDQLKAAQLATAGTFYHRQFAFAKYRPRPARPAPGGRALRLRGRFQRHPGQSVPAH